MINLAAEQLVSLSQAAKSLSTKDHAVDPSTCWRWMTRGCRAKDGTLVKLGAAKVGGRWLTSIEALQKFSDALTGSHSQAAANVPTRTPGRRRQSSERASRKLAEAGI